MSRKEQIKELEAALREPGLTDGFPSQEACLKWAADVAPLLKFEPSYHATFVGHLERLHLDLSADSLGASLRIMTTQVRMAVADLRAGGGEVVLEAAKAGHPHGRYVHPDRLTELASLTGKFDLAKLCRLLEELDLSFRSGCYFATAMLVRAILDHVAPIFGMTKFTEVANNYAGPQSFGKSMRNLEQSSRNIADQYLHVQVRASETLPTSVQVDFSPDLDVLIGEIVRILK